jgi:nuclear pore complex protein Nup85
MYRSTEPTTLGQIAAQSLVREKDYGLAVSYCASAEDWRGIGHIVDRVLDVYITSGLLILILWNAFAYPCTGPVIFARCAADIASSLQELQAQPGPRGVFVHRLTFAVRYAQFHHLRMKQELEDAAADLVAMFHDDIIPKSWWGVLLCDATELLQCGKLFSRF